jgi:hypothetical protein
MSSGIQYANGSSGTFANNILMSDGGALVALGDSILISNNAFFGTVVGLEIDFSPLDVYVANNVFKDNRYAIENSRSSQPFSNISYNDFFENDSDLVNCIGDTTNIFLDPMVQDTIDFRLSLGSPCIDAGDPDPFFNDVDSTRNDIGCWGGPWGESYPYAFIQTLNPEPLPLDFALLPPYPNPFNSVLVIPFTLPHETDVQITIYNILGQKVRHFDLPPLSPGLHRILWHPSSCASGLYIIRLISGNHEFEQKALLLK